jgi:colanic acid/amylovoran biosynthesis glycosyltransferase
MKIAYFINGYPKVSHTFIRREIQAVEKAGAVILRVALRPTEDELIDQGDISEAKITRYVLARGWGNTLRQGLREAATRPMRALSLFATAFRLGLKTDRGVVRHMAYAIEALVLAGWCRVEGIKHVHAQFGTNPAMVARYAAKFSDMTYSFTAHGADEIDQAGSADMQEKLAHASFVATVSWYVRSQLMRRMPFASWDKLKVIHCGLGSDYLTPPAPPFPKQRKLICLGRLCEEKSQHLLVSAFADVRKKGYDIKLILAGDGPLRGAIEAVIAAKKLENHVTITGWIDGERVRSELSDATIMVLPSLLEGLPVAIMEAMALGRPIVSTYVSGIPELVQHGQNGWLVPAGDSGALTEVLATALSCTDAELEAMGRHGKVRVSVRHSSETEAQKLIDLFRPLAG